VLKIEILFENIVNFRNRQQNQKIVNNFTTAGCGVLNNYLLNVSVLLYTHIKNISVLISIHHDKPIIIY